MATGRFPLPGNIFKIVLEKGEVFVQKALSLTKHFKRKISQTPFCCLCDNLPTVKMSFSSLQCLPQVKKVIQENSAKYCMSIRQVIFTFRPKLKTAISLPIFDLFDLFFTSEISFGSLLKLKNQNLKKIANLKAYGNLKVQPLGKLTG